jgi:hypothetical protein
MKTLAPCLSLVLLAGCAQPATFGLPVPIPAATSPNVLVQQPVCRVTWSPPTANVDGSALKDLKEYRVYVGATPQAVAAMKTPSAVVPASSSVPAPTAVEQALCTSLGPGQYYAQISAVNLKGLEGPRPDTVAFRTTVYCVAADGSLPSGWSSGEQAICVMLEKHMTP